MQMNKEAKQCLDLIIDEPIKIGHWLGFKDLTKLHNDWIKMIMFSKEDETLLAHRGSYKTTCISLAISILIGIIICYMLYIKKPLTSEVLGLFLYKKTPG